MSACGPVQSEDELGLLCLVCRSEIFSRSGEVGARGSGGGEGFGVAARKHLKNGVSGELANRGAGEGNRTLASSLGSSHSTTELHPLLEQGRGVSASRHIESVKTEESP